MAVYLDQASLGIPSWVISSTSAAKYICTGWAVGKYAYISL